MGLGLPVCLRAWGTPSPYSRAVVQAGGCDGTAVAARGDRRAQQAEGPVSRCAQRALHARRPRCATVRHRFIDRCNLTKLPDSICNLTISSLYARLSDARCIRNPICVARPAPQGRVEQCPPRAAGVRVQHGQPNVAVRAAGNLEACAAAPSARCCRRNAERNQLQALPGLASCRSGGTETLLYVCVRCARVLLSGPATEGRLWFAADSSATTASKLCPDFRARCSGCAPSAAAVPCHALVLVPRTRRGSALGWLGAHAARRLTTPSPSSTLSSRRMAIVSGFSKSMGCESCAPHAPPRRGGGGGGGRERLRLAAQ
jgi:hypothetical protein